MSPTVDLLPAGVGLLCDLCGQLSGVKQALLTLSQCQAKVSSDPVLSAS